jgi:hypothetical protein
MRRAQGEGLVGLGELSPHAQGYRTDGAEFAAVLAEAAALNWPVNLHVTDGRGLTYPGRIETPRADFVRLAADWPTVTFILAHWGGGEVLAGERGEVFENVRYDTAASPLLYGAEIWRRFVLEAGAGNVLFGSDYPLNNYPTAEAGPEMSRFLAAVRGADLDDEARGAILAENAQRLFGRGV